jgi:hypothetical protein
MAGCVVALAMIGCKPEVITYNGPSYVMFADTLAIYPVQVTNESFAVPVVATRTVDYDRNFAVEVVMDGSDAVYGVQYRLESHTVTIPAGGNTGHVMVKGVYDNIESNQEVGEKEPVLKLRLLSVNEDIEWDLYGVETKVVLRKSCPFDINDYTGYCLVYSPFVANSIYERQNPRLIRTEVVAGEENTIWLKDFFFDGFDVKLRFDNSDLLNPRVALPAKQELGDSREAFVAIYGDGRMWADNYPGLDSNFYSCDRVVTMYLYITFSNYGAGGQEAVVAADGLVLEWITDADAQDYL